MKKKLFCVLLVLIAATVVCLFYMQTYIPRDWNVLELTVFPRSVYLDFSKGEEQSVYYVFDPTGEIHEKTIGLYGRNLFGNRTVIAIFCNQNGQITNLKEKRLWFEWLKR